MLRAAELQGLPKESVSLVQQPAHQVALLTCTYPTLWWFVGGRGEINEVYSEEDTPPSPPKL